MDGRGNDVARSSKGRHTLNGGIDTDRLADKAGRRGDRHFGKVQDTLNAKDGRRSDLLSDGLVATRTSTTVATGRGVSSPQASDS